MKKILLSLIVTLCAMSSHAQTIEVFKNGKSIATYTNAPNEHYVVKFYSTGDYDHINGHEYVIIGGLKWATMNVGATTVAESNATAYGDFYAWGEIDTYYKSYTDTSVSWYKQTDLTHIPGSKFSHNWPNYSGGDDSFKEWNPVPYDDKYQLTADNDIAHTAWGGTWRMPTKDDFKKLYDACVDERYSSINSSTKFAKLKPLPDDGNITEGGIYGVPQNSTVDSYPYNVAGVLFVSKEDPNQRIFFPAAGNIRGTKLESVGTQGTYWSATGYPQTPSTSYTLYMSKERGISLNQILPRCNGFSIRPVSD